MANCNQDKLAPLYLYELTLELGCLRRCVQSQDVALYRWPYLCLPKNKAPSRLGCGRYILAASLTCQVEETPPSPLRPGPSLFSAPSGRGHSAPGAMPLTHIHTQAAAGGFCHVLPQVGTPPIHLQGREKRRRCRCSPFLGTWSERKEGRKGKRQTRCAQHENGCLICQRVLFVCACLHVSVCDQNIRKTREKQHLFSHCAGWPSLR